MHIDQDLGDIGYNFLIGGDGAVYEGLGWFKEGAHTYRYNRRSIGIGFIGNFVDSKPPQKQLVAARILIDEGLSKGIIDPTFRVFGQLQLRPTLSPGAALMEIIQLWTNWSDDIWRF